MKHGIMYYQVEYRMCYKKSFSWMAIWYGVVILLIFMWLKVLRIFLG